MRKRSLAAAAFALALLPAAPAIAQDSTPPKSQPGRNPATRRPIPVRSRAGNLQGLELTEDQMTSVVAHRNADGTISFECVEGKGNEARAIARPPRKTARKERPDEK